MASRSGGDGEWHFDKPSSEEEGKSFAINRSERPVEGELNEITLHLKVGYKTVLLVVVVFDLVHISIREIVDSNLLEEFIQKL